MQEAMFLCAALSLAATPAVTTECSVGAACSGDFRVASIEPPYGRKRVGTIAFRHTGGGDPSGRLILTFGGPR